MNPSCVHSSSVSTTGDYYTIYDFYYCYLHCNLQSYSVFPPRRVLHRDCHCYFQLYAEDQLVIRVQIISMIIVVILFVILIVLVFMIVYFLLVVFCILVVRSGSPKP